MLHNRNESFIGPVPLREDLSNKNLEHGVDVYH